MTKINDRIKKFAKEDDKIRSLIETGRRVNPLINSQDEIDYHYVFGVHDLVDFKDPRYIEEVFNDLLLIRKSDKVSYSNKINPNNVNYNIVLDDISKVTLFFIEENTMQEYINQDTQSKIIMDKDDLLVGNPTRSDVYFRQAKPSRTDFETACSDIFMYSLVVAKALYRNEELYAMKMFLNVIYALDRMTSYYIGCNYNFSVNVGYNFEYIKTYLSEDHYKRYLQAYPTPYIDDLWKKLFNACELFRKEGLYVAESLGYEYPKKADRDILKKIRDIKSRSFN
ncbi:MAG: aminoglycoside 6-adenylyltransferase [Finegoldia sp.]|nr:aminoglycoside 6-adenylyltransferase [Finegoldia sp.]